MWTLKGLLMFLITVLSFIVNLSSSRMSLLYQDDMYSLLSKTLIP
jgi:hypothetical protein